MIKVMIVEDEILVRLGLKNSVDWAKHGMVVAADLPNGKAALDFYRSEKPDVILTDIKMPVMDGMELITQIRKTDADTVIVVLTCLEEFGLIKKAMSLGVTEYLLKLTATTEEIDALLEKLRLQIHRKERSQAASGTASRAAAGEELIKNYIFYNSCTQDEFARQSGELGLPLWPDSLLLILVELGQYRRIKEKFEDEKGFLVHFAFMNILNEILDKKGVAIYERDARYILLLSEQSSRTERPALLERIEGAARAYFGVSLTFAASAMYDGFGNLPGMYREAEARLACKFFYGSGVIGLDEERNAAAVMREKLAQLYSFGDLARLPEALLWENYKAKADDMINGLSPDPAAVKDALCVLLHWLSRQLYLNGDEDYAKLVSYEQTLSQAETLDDALEEVKRYIALLNHALRARKQLRPEITAALQFIGEHYKNNLSLRDVARHVGLSPSYFSTLFKKEIDVTMTEYLNALRIDEAKRLLRETDMKTYEVSEAAGFWESTYFNALFKRLTGVTPYKYREQWQAAGAEADKP